MQRINLKIDVSKIDKSNLFKGQKGTYLDATLVLNDTNDENGNRGLIFQDFLKENKKNADGSWAKTPILGNAKIWDDNPSQATTKVESNPTTSLDPPDDEDDLPF